MAKCLSNNQLLAISVLMQMTGHRVNNFVRITDYNAKLKSYLPTGTRQPSISKTQSRLIKRGIIVKRLNYVALRPDVFLTPLSDMHEAYKSTKSYYSTR